MAGKFGSRMGSGALGLRQAQMAKTVEAKRRVNELADNLADQSSVTLPSEQIAQEVAMASVSPETGTTDLIGSQMVEGIAAPEGLAVPGEERVLGVVADRPRQRTVEGFDDQDPTQAAMALDPQDPTTFQLTQETANRLQQEQLAKLSPTGRFEGVMSEEEALEAGQRELQQGYRIKSGALLSEEGARNFGNYVDAELAKQHYRDFAISDNAPMFSIETGMENAAKSFRFDGGKMNIFATQIPNAYMDPTEIGNVARAQDIIRQNANTFQYIVKSNDKLAMAENDADPNSEIRGEFGRTAFLAVLLELGNRLNLQSTEIDKQAAERLHDNAMDRVVFGRAVADRIEQMLYHSADIDASSFTGEIKSPGYTSRLTSDEKDVLGQVILQGFADSPMFDWLQTVTISDPSGNNKPKYTYVVSDEGAYQVPRMRRALMKELGMAAHERPVSLVPTAEGILISESGYTQNEITRQVVPNRLTKTVKEGISALSKVAHTVSPHKVSLFAGVMSAALQDNQSIFAKFTKQDPAYLTNKTNELYERFLQQFDRGEISLPPLLLDTLAQQGRSTPTRAEVEEGFKDEAYRQAQRIQRIHFNLRAESLADGANRIGTSFYYGYTAINNSSRMMISNTELNYQADKVARFLVDGAKPVEIKKGSNSRAERGFFEVLARSLVEGADKKLPKDQVALFQEQIKRFNGMAADVMNYMDKIGGVAKQQDLTGDPARELQEAIKAGRIPSLNSLSSTTKDYLGKMGKDGFYFALDALHELGKYNRLANNASFKTRVKAEVDGNANGAVIQAMQMGLINILSRGGVIYSNAEDLEKDIREEVFEAIEANVKAQPGRPHEGIIKEIRGKGLIKDLLKIPIMTSIYGKDPEFHEDTAYDFYDSNSSLFGTMDKEEAVEFLRSQIEFSIKATLGGALEHGKMMKRMGRAFNFANQIAQIEGANDFMVQAGGWERIETGAETIPLAQGFSQQEGVQRAGSQLRTDTMVVGFGRNIPFAQTEADSRRLRDASRSDPGVGSKLRNQIAVNGTQNIDATIAQKTVTEVGKIRNGHNMMQVYDAFMGDALSFSVLRDEANTFSGAASSFIR